MSLKDKIHGKNNWKSPTTNINEQFLTYMEYSTYITEIHTNALQKEKLQICFISESVFFFQYEFYEIIPLQHFIFLFFVLFYFVFFFLFLCLLLSFNSVKLCIYLYGEYVRIYAMFATMVGNNNDRKANIYRFIKKNMNRWLFFIFSCLENKNKNLHLFCIRLSLCVSIVRTKIYLYIFFFLISDN